jgi:hypothetical protein
MEGRYRSVVETILRAAKSRGAGSNRVRAGGQRELKVYVV